MGTGTASAPTETVTKRRVPRYKLTVPLDLTVLRSGIPDNISGRTLEMGEGGLGVEAPARLTVGESVRVEFLVPHTMTPVRATAVVRYQRGGCFGLEFLRLPAEQRSTIQYWTRREGELLVAEQASTRLDAGAEALELPYLASWQKPAGGLAGRAWVVFGLVALLVGGALGWWQWQQGWADLEDHLPANIAVRPQVKVAGEVMERQIVHKSLPEYPEAARQAGVQGSVVLDTVVGSDGGVNRVRLVSGPETLAQAAMDAVRWWRYEPYRVDGRAVAVETTVTVDFRLAK